MQEEKKEDHLGNQEEQETQFFGQYHCATVVDLVNGLGFPTAFESLTAGQAEHCSLTHQRPLSFLLLLLAFCISICFTAFALWLGKGLTLEDRLGKTQAPRSCDISSFNRGRLDWEMRLPVSRKQGEEAVSHFRNIDFSEAAPWSTPLGQHGSRKTPGELADEADRNTA
jgi:hypothetical protein